MKHPRRWSRTAPPAGYRVLENFDGSGYPRGLRDDEIPLPARIVAVVDCWDALSFHGCYAKVWPQAMIIAHLQSLRATKFDPAGLKVVYTEHDHSGDAEQSRDAA